MTKQPNSPQQGQAGQQGQPRGESSTRQQQQYDAGQGGSFAAQIREHMEVIGADGARIGKVDAVEGDRIKLVRADWPNDGAPGASHHFLPLGQVRSIDGDAVRLAVNADEATRQASRV